MFLFAILRQFHLILCTQTLHILKYFGGERKINRTLIKFLTINHRVTLIVLVCFQDIMEEGEKDAIALYKVYIVT